MVVEPKIVAPTEINPPWMTNALHTAGIGRGSEVVAIESRSIGTGQVGENVRFALTWSPGGERLPTSVVGKFPSPSETSRAAAAATRTYEREVGFYRDMAHLAAVRTPDVFHVAGDLASNTFTLIMSDVSPARVGDQLVGCSVDDAELATQAAADLHGSTWGTVKSLEQLSWTDALTPERTDEMSAIYDQLFEGFVDRYESQLTGEALEWGRWIGVNMAKTRGHAIDGCLVHGDFRLDNMLFGLAQDQSSLTVVDWQTANIGIGPVDLAYFVGAGLLPDLRRQQERRLFDLYENRLRSLGVEVDSDQLWRSYRLGSAAGYIMAVVASQLVEQTKRGDEMFLAMASRHALQMTDLELRTNAD